MIVNNLIGIPKGDIEVGTRYTVCVMCQRELSVSEKIHPTEAAQKLQGQLEGQRVFRVPGARAIGGGNDPVHICEKCLRQVISEFDPKEKSEEKEEKKEKIEKEPKEKPEKENKKS